MDTADFLIVDDATKVLPSRTPQQIDSFTVWGAPGERVAFQLAYRFARQARTPRWPTWQVSISSPGAKIWAADVELVPARCASWRDDETDYEQPLVALLPDRLVDLATADSQLTADLRCRHAGWNSLWVEAELPATQVTVEVRDGETQLFSATLEVHTATEPIPPAPVEHVRWFHHDSLAQYYGVEMWSEAHWKAISAQMRAAVDAGITTLMMPLWTPPLDVLPGNYRPCTQLVGMYREKEGYRWDFALADRWLDEALAAGIKGVEVPHFFTQWGAISAAGFYLDQDPIEAARNATAPTFGWHTSATDPEYHRFLAHLIPAVKNYLEVRVPNGVVLWHISDEPLPEHKEAFAKAATAVRGLLGSVTIIDALSHPEYVPLVDNPVVATSEVKDFRACGIEPHWVYYCVSQSTGQANQLLAQSGVHHRIQGFQFYKFRISGFLHWGLNFYFTQYSKALVEPSYDTDAGGNFLSGDPFLIYPGPNYTPQLSLRHRMIGAAWRDLALAYYAESKLGRQKVLEIIDPDGDLDYDAGFTSAQEYHRRRRALWEAISTVSA